MNKENFKKVIHTKMFWIILGVIGIWGQLALSLYNSFSYKGYDVYVNGGSLDEISSTISVDGQVNADVINTVDVNLSEINGHNNCFYNNYTKHPNDYYRIPVIMQ